MMFMIIFLILLICIYCIFYLLEVPITDKIKKKENFNKLHGNSKIPFSLEFQKIYEKISSNSIYKEINDFKASAETKLLFGLISFFLLFFGTLTFIGFKITLLIAYILLLIIYLIIIFKPAYSQFKTLYKNNVILPLVENISPTIRYTHENASPTEEAYKTSSLESSFYNKYISDDYMYGSIKGYNFNLSNIHTEHVRESDIGKMVTHLFNGIFIYSYTNSNIDFNFKILNKKFIIAKPNFEIDLSDPEFSKNYRLFSENHDEILDVLKPEILNVIKIFTQTYGVPFDLSVSNNAFYFRFYTGTSFESHLFKNSNNIYILNMYYSIIKFTIDFIDTFKKYN